MSTERPAVRLPVRKEDISRLSPTGYNRAEVARLLDAADPDKLFAAAATWHAASSSLNRLHDDLRFKAEAIAVDWDGAAAAACQSALRRIAGTARQLARHAADLHQALSTAAHAQQRAKDDLAAFRANPVLYGSMPAGRDGTQLFGPEVDGAVAEQVDHTARQWLQRVYDGYRQAMVALPDRISYDLPDLSAPSAPVVNDAGPSSLKRPNTEPVAAPAADSVPTVPASANGQPANGVGYHHIAGPDQHAGAGHSGPVGQSVGLGAPHAPVASDHGRHAGPGGPYAGGYGHGEHPADTDHRARHGHPAGEPATGRHHGSHGPQDSQHPGGGQHGSGSHSGTGHASGQHPATGHGPAGHQPPTGAAHPTGDAHHAGAAYPTGGAHDAGTGQHSGTGQHVGERGRAGGLGGDGHAGVGGHSEAVPTPGPAVAGGLAAGAGVGHHAIGLGAGAGLSAQGPLGAEAGLAAGARDQADGGPGHMRSDSGTVAAGGWIPPGSTAASVEGGVAGIGQPAGAAYSGYAEDGGTMLAGGIGGAVAPLDPNQPVGADWDGAGSDSPYATAAEPHRDAGDHSLPSIPVDGPLADQSHVDPGAIAGTVAGAVAEAEHQHHPGPGGLAPGDVPLIPGGGGQHPGMAPATGSPGTPGAGGVLDAPYIAATVAESVAGAAPQHPGAHPAPGDVPSGHAGPGQQAPLPDQNGTPAGQHVGGLPNAHSAMPGDHGGLPSADPATTGGHDGPPNAHPAVGGLPGTHSGGGAPAGAADQAPPTAAPLPDAHEPVTVPDNPLPDLRP